MAPVKLTMDWHERAGAGWLLRLAGIALLGLAWGAAYGLRQRALAGPASQDSVAYLLALLGFVFASTGVALAVMGARLFDRIEIAARWRPARDQSDPA